MKSSPDFSGEPFCVVYMRLEGKIRILVLVEIQRFHFWGYAFAGIVAEFSAAAIGRHNPALCAEDLLIADRCSVLTVGAGTADFFAK